MRFVRFGDAKRTGIVIESPEGPAVIDILANVERGTTRLRVETRALIRRLLANGSWAEMIGSWAAVRPCFEELSDFVSLSLQAGDEQVTWYRPSELLLAAPLPSPTSRIFALGGNFLAHAADAFSRMSGHKMVAGAAAEERKRGLPPWGFLVIPDLIVGDGTLITPPHGVTRLDYEGEVAAVIGVGGRDLAESDVSFWGLTAFHDFSIRDGLREGTGVDRGPLVWAMSKNFETGKSMGPWVSVDAGLNEEDVAFSLTVNGMTRQQGTTKDMIYSFREVAVFLSRYLPLLPGDVIASGTPKGTALDSDLPYLAPGDDVVMALDGVGELRHSIGRW